MKALTGHWLLRQDHLDAYLESARTFEVDTKAYEAFIARRSRPPDADGELFVREGPIAHVMITGVLTEEPDFFFDIFGGGSAVYGDIIAAIEAAELDNEITEIVLEINSPGGDVAGFFRTAQAIAATSKPVTAEITNMAASAAFGLAVQADKVIAENRMVMVGSVGVATTVFVSDIRIQIASTEAPNKRPDPTTEEGLAAIRQELDAIHAEFATIIASGRGVSVAEVNADFGRGGLVIAGDALQVGMIDGISGGATVEGADGATEEKGSDLMNLQELQAKHPELHAELMALGVAQERDRVTAHVKAGKAVGKPDIAFKFIESGEDFTSQTVQSEYLTASITKTETDARAADDSETVGLTNAGSQKVGDNAEADIDALTNEMFDTLENNLGITVGAN